MKKSKRYTELKKAFNKEDKVTLEQAIEKLKENAKAKFDESIEIAMRLGVDPKKSDQMIRGGTTLPNGTGKKVKILVFAEGEKANEAKEAGADYIGVGPVFDTATKQNRGSLVGLDLIAVANDISSIPYVAIGGIKKDNIKALADTGCRRAAVISDILTAPDIENHCRLLKGLLLTPS